MKSFVVALHGGVIYLGMSHDHDQEDQKVCLFPLLVRWRYGLAFTLLY
jgi:hypothetical protein